MMSNWFNNNLKKNLNGLLSFDRLKNKKLKFGGIAGLVAALFGVWLWQTAAAGNAPVTGLLPARADNQPSLKVQNNTPPPLETAVPGANASNSSSTDVSVNVNGQNVVVPSEGSFHKVINDANGTTTIDVNVQNKSSGSSGDGNYTRSNLSVNSNSNTSVHQDVNQEVWGGDAM